MASEAIEKSPLSTSPLGRRRKDEKEKKTG